MKGKYGIDDYEYDNKNKESQVRFSSSGRPIRSSYSKSTTTDKQSKVIAVSDNESDVQKAISLSLKQQQFAGLVNHGATCYLNSLLQCLFVRLTVPIVFLFVYFIFLVQVYDSRIQDASPFIS